jgi:hypothetical protein
MAGVTSRATRDCVWALLTASGSSLIPAGVDLVLVSSGYRLHSFVIRTG